MNTSRYDALTLANAFIDAGEIDDALAVLTPHLDANPEDDAARRLRAAVYARLPLFTNAAHEDYRALRTPTHDDHIADAVIFSRQGDPVNAARILGNLLERTPEDDDLLEQMLHRLMTHPGLFSQHPEVVQLLDDRLTQNPAHWRWWGWRGDLAAVMDDDHGAITAYTHGLVALDTLIAQTAASPNPILVNQKAQFYLKRADVAHRLSRYREADDDLGAAERLLPTDEMIPFKGALMAYEANLAADANAWESALRRALPICRAALDRASPLIRQLMHDALRADPVYRPLVEALLA